MIDPYSINLLSFCAVFITAFATQYIFSFLHSLNYDFRSAIISCLSISILLKSNSIHTYALCTAIAISSKFILSYNRRHFFNPVNIGIVLSLLFSDAWLSPGIFGTSTNLIIIACCLASAVLSQSKSYITSAGFMISFCGLLALRNFWLANPSSIFINEISQISFLIFVFFMISDPKTSPITTKNQLLYGLVIGASAFTFKYLFYITYGVLYSLFIGSLLMMLIAILKDKRYQNA